jgi:hypothetical protein
MGIDVVIRIETRGAELPQSLRSRYADRDWSPVSTEDGPVAHQFELCLMSRLWAPDYPRGDWLELLGLLVDLLASPEVVNVWYGGDSYDGRGDLVTEDFLVKYTKAFIAMGRGMEVE